MKVTMNLSQKVDFVQELSFALRDQVLHAVFNGKIPENFGEKELRELMAAGAKEIQLRRTQS